METTIVRLRICCILFVASILLAACGGASMPAPGAPAQSDAHSGAAISAAEPTAAPAQARQESGTAAPTIAPAPPLMEVAPGESMPIDGSEDEIAAPPTSPDPEAGKGDTAKPNQMASGQQQPLQAGSIDDNEHFSAYLNYLADYQGTYNSLPIDLRERYLLRIMDSDQHGVFDAQVRIYDGEALLFEGLSYSDGSLQFNPTSVNASDNAQSFRVLVERGQAQAEYELLRGQTDRVHEIAIASEADTQQLTIDLLFLLDATGSMDDEIKHIQETIISISERVSQLPGSPELRFALVAYKDRSDDYLTRSSDFTSDVQAFRTTLLALRAGGGGDTPEALNEGLYSAVHDLSWSEHGLRLAFMVADAPPHVNQPDSPPYPTTLVEAQSKGIKIFTIAASNSNPAAEYVMRQIAQQTMARFIFLTYQEGESSGRPGQSTELSAGDAPQGYTVSRLDDLIVDLIQQELDNAMQALLS